MSSCISFRVPVSFIRHDNHTPTASLVARTFTKPVDFVLFRNTDTSLSINVSFDGTNSFTLRPLESLSMEVVRMRGYYTQATSGSPALQVMTGSQE